MSPRAKAAAARRGGRARGRGGDDPPEIIRRKSDHVGICLRDDVQHSTDWWDDVQLVHCAMPEVDLAAIDTTTSLFGHDIGAPLVIASMTGGHEHGADINDHLAAAAAELRLPMGVGSQRPALEHPSYARTYVALKEHDVPLVIANIGAPQLVRQRGGAAMGPREVRAAMEMIDADMVAVHLNFLQEVAQPEGDTNAEGVLEAIALLASEFPVIVKETGGGISQEIALLLKAAGVRGIDVGGAGGTSFAAVEAVRSQERGLADRARLGWAFKDWGIPTPVSTLEASVVGLPIIATGGVRSGLDIARAVVLGASAAGVARRVLGPSLKGRRETREALDELIAGLRAAMFLTGSRDVGALRERDFVLSDRLMAWVGRLVQEGD